MMRNIFALIGLGAITFLGLGWYLDWYHFSRQPAATPGTQRFEVDLNPNKITTDVKKGIERGGEIVDRLRESKPAPAATLDKPAPPDEVQPLSPTLSKPGPMGN
jgi:hypothetical protein